MSDGEVLPLDQHRGQFDWNVLVTFEEDTRRLARKRLSRWGELRRTAYFNVMAMKVADPDAFLEELAELVQATPGLRNLFSHVVPAQATFAFTTAEEFENSARAIALDWVPRLAGKAFHVRMHRRGFAGKLSSQTEERFLDAALLEALAARGTPGRMAFEDPDAILQIETIGGRAGMSLWDREQLRRLPFLGVD